jgi:thymidylate kinase
MFIAELHEKVETGVLATPLGSIILTDRGLLSKYVYQVAVLSEEWDTARASTWTRVLLEGIPPPDLTICLAAELDVLLRRIENRGETRTPGQGAFIASLRSQFLSAVGFGPVLHIDTTTLTESEVLKIALEAIQERRS